MGHILYLAMCVALGAYSAVAYKSHRLATKMSQISQISDTRADVVGGATHPCYRTCVKGDSRVCEYTFTVTEYSTMAIACGDCPYTAADCYARGCITAGGEPREIKAVNHMMPGPSIQVCEGDTIRVTFNNAFGSEAATIHWHGIYQRETPYMDGVPWVTQCPIQPSTTFVYNFTANPPGTHLWHSHAGFQEPDGVFGSLLVRQPNDPLAQYYDFDLPEHGMIIWHWWGEPATPIVKSSSFRSIVALGHSLIINGYTAVAQFTKDGLNYTTPRANFTVTQGYRYRFRAIVNTALFCPVQVSVDNHTLQVIATDGTSVKPVTVDTFVMSAGERYDFVLNADQPIGNYWIRYRGFGNCERNSTFSLAVLHYENANHTDPEGVLTYADTGRSGVLLNPSLWPTNYTDNTLITLADLQTTSPEAEDVTGTPDHTFYFTLGLNEFPQFQTPGPYAQMNSISYDAPAVPLLTQYRDLKPDMLCTPNNYSVADCVDDYCTCPTVFAAKYGSIVEVVIFDNTTVTEVTHPMHMHGGHYRVVAMEYGNGSLTLEDVKARNEAGLIEKNFETAPLKDTVAVPSRGFAVIRFRADNPGYWFFHCHYAVHQEEGMAVVLKVGEHSEMKQPPRDFPICGDYDITATREHLPNQTSSPLNSPNKGVFQGLEADFEGLEGEVKGWGEDLKDLFLG